MGLTNFQNGITSFGIVQMGAGHIPATTGNVFFVDSGKTNASNNNLGTSPDKVLATIDGAINKCSANNGDLIIVMPGHSEGISASGDIAQDVAGVSVIGLGQGDSRPQVVYNNAAASWIVSASNCRISNIIFVASVADVLAGVIVNGATTNTEIDNCKWTFDATTLEFKHMLELGGGGTGAAADQTIIRNNWFRAENIAGGDSAIKIDDCFDIHIVDNLITGDYTSVAIDGLADSSLGKDYVITGNRIQQLDGTFAIALDTAATGVAFNNWVSGAGALATAVLDWGELTTCENYAVDATNASGVLLPATTAA